MRRPREAAPEWKDDYEEASPPRADQSWLRAGQGQRPLLAAASAATNNLESPRQPLPARRPYWLQRTSAPSDWPMRRRAHPIPGPRSAAVPRIPALWPRLQSGRNHEGSPPGAWGEGRPGGRGSGGLWVSCWGPGGQEGFGRGFGLRPGDRRCLLAGGGGRLGPRRQGTPSGRSAPLRGAGGGSRPVPSPPCSWRPILGTGFQNEVKRQPPTPQTA